jgi:serine/threonine protein phosphatase 1
MANRSDKIPTSRSSDLVTFAIGDIHGCLDKLLSLLERCENYASGRPRRFVFLGDYVDRGPDSRGVITTLRQRQESRNDETICLRGNHEALLLAAVREGEELLWLVNGGGTTLASYGITEPGALPADDLLWIQELALSFDDGQRFYVHAGVNPMFPLDQQSEQDQVWIREPFLSSDREFGRLIVHGHTPLAEGRPDLRRNRLNIDTAAVLGGPLTAAVFTGERTEPVAFLTDAPPAARG